MLNWDLQKNNDKITLFLFGSYLAAPCYQCGSNVAFFCQKVHLIKLLLNGIYLVFSILIQLVLQRFVIFTRVSKINKTVRLVYPPKQLLTLADLVGLSDWIANFT